MIQFKLPHNKITFVVVEAVPGRKTPDVKSADTEIVLMYDRKHNGVLTTPKFYGRIFEPKKYADYNEELNHAHFENDSNDDEYY